MTYYKVKKECDQERRPGGSIYIGGELYTAKEAERLKLNLDYMEKVELKMTNTYWSFGARFEAEA